MEDCNLHPDVVCCSEPRRHSLKGLQEGCGGEWGGGGGEGVSRKVVVSPKP